MRQRTKKWFKNSMVIKGTQKPASEGILGQMRVYSQKKIVLNRNTVKEITGLHVKIEST